jgi:hypothetical protein
VRRSRAAATAATAATLAAVLGLAACSTPEGDPAMYREEALSTLRAARSEVETVRITLGLRIHDRTFGRAADDAVSTAETGLSGAAGTFTGLQPPSGADAVRDQATQLLSDAQDAVEEARIAVRRDDLVSMRKAYDDVTASSADLEKAPEELA